MKGDWRGRVVAVLDGDTLDVRNPAGSVVRVRIVGIDAPEMATAAGRRSRRRLARLCPVAAEVLVRPASAQVDPYRRLLAEVLVDAGATQLASGFARRWRSDG